MKLNRLRKNSVLLLTVALFLTWTALTVSQAQELTGVKCVVNGKKSATAGAKAEYKGGSVYFCCDHCAAEFLEDQKLKEKAVHTIKANHQLVLTRQFVQKGCPMSGSPVEENLVAEVGGTKVGFCCEGCMNKVKNAGNLEARAKLVFAESAFQKAFQKKQAEVNLGQVKCVVMPNSNAVLDKSVDYRQGKVYFCCGECAGKFAAAPATYSALANQQLVVTGQYVQTGCPISGGDVDDEQSSVVGGVAVKFCCEKCKAKVDGAATEQGKIELVFGDRRFEKAFAKD